MDLRSVVELLFLALVSVGAVALLVAFLRQKKLTEAAARQAADAYVKGWLGAEMRQLRQLSDDEIAIKLADRLDKKE